MQKDLFTVSQKQILDAYDAYSLQYAQSLHNPAIVRAERLLDPIKKEYQATIHQYMFWMVVHMKERKATYTLGLKEALGYSDSADEKSARAMRQVLEWVHPHRLQLFLQFAQSAYMATQKYRNYLSEAALPCYRIRVPMLHANGSYYWVHQTSFPLEIDDQGFMVTHLNQNYVGLPYRGELLEPPDVQFTAIGFTKIKDDLLQQARYYFRHILDIRFDPIHGKIFEIYFQNPEAGIKDIERVTGWKGMDIKNYQRKILRIASEYFHYPFATCKEAVHYLHRIGWQYEVLRE